MDDLTRGPDLGSPASIRGDYRRLDEACPVARESIPSPVVN